MLKPVGEKERIESLDVLRGFALFGILLINWRSPTLGSFVTQPGSLADKIIGATVELFVHQKFYPLFSMMFGLGMALQIERSARAGGSFDAYFIRRLLVLFCIGLAHHFLVWNGDVLNVYAMCGVVLLVCRRSPTPVLVVLGIVLLPIPGLLGLLPPTIVSSVPLPGGPHGLIGTAVTTPVLDLSYPGLVVARVTDFVVRKSYLRTYLGVADVAGLFLLGLAIGRTGVFRNLEANRSLLYRVVGFGALIGLAGHGWDFVLRRLAVVAEISVQASDFLHWILTNEAIRGCVKAWSRAGLATAYAGVLLLLLGLPQGRRLLGPLASLGRTALSGYLTISVVGAFLFYGYGLGLHNTLGWSVGLMAVCLFFLLQIAVSVVWLRHFVYGPVEWIWRSLTYGFLQPFKRSLA